MSRLGGVLWVASLAPEFVRRRPPRFEQCGYFGRNSRARYNKKVRVWNKTGGYCRYCSGDLDFMRNFDIDHVVPKSRGGTNDIENLEPACVACNLSKWNRPLQEFLASRGGGQ